MIVCYCIVYNTVLLLPAKCVGRNFIHYELCCPCGTYGVYLRSWQVCARAGLSVVCLSHVKSKVQQEQQQVNEIFYSDTVELVDALAPI